LQRFKWIFLGLFFVSCSLLPFINDSSTDHVVRLDVVGDTQAYQVYVDGFEQLTTSEKIFAYYLTQAGIAGRDIYYDQNHKHALEIRNLCEELLLFPHQMGDTTYQKLRAYTHRIWMNSSQYHHFSKNKFSPQFTYDELLKSAKSVSPASHDSSQSTIQSLQQLKPFMFDTNFQPQLTVKNPPPDGDIIFASANNLYDGVTYPELNDWIQQGSENYPMNSQIVKTDSGIVELVYRSGIPDSGIVAGLYAAPLQEIIFCLKLAAPHADTSQMQTINNLIRYYKTGEAAYFNQAIINWLRHNPRVDFLQGFIEVYTDPRGRKGAFQNIVYFVDETKTEMMKKLVDLAPYFEAKAPFAEKFKRTDFSTQPMAIAANVISGQGDGGPITPAGINLPNNQQFRERYGSKNLIFTNIIEMNEGKHIKGRLPFIRKLVYEFFHPDDISAIRKVKGEANFALVCLHELIGHGSSKNDSTLLGSPIDSLREYYSTIEEARAELMALWFLHDPKLLDIGLVPSKEAADEIFRQKVRYDLVQLCNMKNRDAIEEDHERARHLIINYVRENSNAIKMYKIRGKLYTKIDSMEKFREALRELLIEVTRIKAQGDYAAARELIQKYGIYFNKTWRDEMVLRYEKIHQGEPIVVSSGFSMPILVPVKNKSGEIVEVNVKYLKNFEKEQLYYSGKVKIF